EFHVPTGGLACPFTACSSWWHLSSAPPQARVPVIRPSPRQSCRVLVPRHLHTARLSPGNPRHHRAANFSPSINWRLGTAMKPCPGGLDFHNNVHPYPSNRRLLLLRPPSS